MPSKSTIPIIPWTINLDQSEYDSDTTMPHIDNARLWPDLESLTGADCLISPIALPCATEALIRKHLKAGAILIQIKRGMDLASSVGERLIDSLCRMQTIGAVQSQCCLLHVGTLLCNRDGEAFIQDQGYSQLAEPYIKALSVDKIIPGSHVNYKGIRSALNLWCFRGGVVLANCPEKSMLNPYLHNLAEQLVELSVERIKFYIMSTDIVHELDTVNLQGLIKAPPMVQIIASWPGVGHKTARLIYDHFQGNIYDAMINMESAEGNWPEGSRWGKQRAKTLAEAFGHSEKKGGVGLDEDEKENV